MNAPERKLRRQQLDRLIQSKVKSLSAIPTPKGGWIQAIREALGMNLETLGRRLGVTRQSAYQLERAEARGTITVKRLRAAAQALDCELVVLLVPRTSLEKSMKDRALAIAREEIARTGQTMQLEAQDLSKHRLEEMVRERADQLMALSDPRLWA